MESRVEHLTSTIVEAPSRAGEKGTDCVAGSDAAMEHTKQHPGHERPKARDPRPKRNDRAPGTKAETVLKRLRLAKGTSIEQLMAATGWQAHSVLTSETGNDGIRRYRVVDSPAPGDRHAQ